MPITLKGLKGYTSVEKVAGSEYLNLFFPLRMKLSVFVLIFEPVDVLFKYGGLIESYQTELSYSTALVIFLFLVFGLAIVLHCK